MARSTKGPEVTHLKSRSYWVLQGFADSHLYHGITNDLNTKVEWKKHFFDLSVLKGALQYQNTVCKIWTRSVRCEDPRKIVEVLEIQYGFKNEIFNFLNVWGQKDVPGWEGCKFGLKIEIRQHLTPFCPKYGGNLANLAILPWFNSESYPCLVTLFIYLIWT